MRARGDRGRTGQGRFVLHGKPGHGAGAGKNAVAALLHRGRVRRHYGRSGARGNGRCGAGETGGDGMNAPLATRSWRRDFPGVADRSEEHTSELQSLMRISYAVFCLKNKHTIPSKIATAVKSDTEHI